MYITEFKIDNFRSLKEIHLKDMQRICIFHGDNNSGKSNILAAIEAVLKAKYKIEITKLASGEGQEFTKDSPFNAGRLRDFVNNFYFDSKDPITFSISVVVDDDELVPYKDVLEKIKTEQKLAAKHAAKGKQKPRGLKLHDGHDKVVTIDGELRYQDANTCEAVTSRIVINTHFLLFENVDNAPIYVPSLQDSKVEVEDRVKLVDSLMTSITGVFQVIGANRFIGEEILRLDEKLQNSLTSTHFKRVLFNLATDKEGYEIFKDINTRFNSEPFSFGDISFLIEPISHGIELMIEKSSKRLPLNRMGSGLQQILFLIANIVSNEKKMVGIEEIELNLSPKGQKDVFETIKKLVYKAKLISQALVTSHSPYFRDREDVRYFEVGYDTALLRTVVNPATKENDKKFFGVE